MRYPTGPRHTCEPSGRVVPATTARQSRSSCDPRASHEHPDPRHVDPGRRRLPARRRLRHGSPRPDLRARARRSRDLSLLPSSTGSAPASARTPLAAADGQESYTGLIGDSVYYGDCLSGKSPPLGGGGCELPLQITHRDLPPARRTPRSGRSATSCCAGCPPSSTTAGTRSSSTAGASRSTSTPTRSPNALRAVAELRPMNAPGSAAGALPAPVYCPGLSGAPTGAGAARAGAASRPCLPARRRDCRGRQGDLRKSVTSPRPLPIRPRRLPAGAAAACRSRGAG